MTTLAELQRWMTGGEDEHLEFKEAKQQFGSDDLLSYCIAIANERGGRIVLGVTDRQPRRVVGSAVCMPPRDAKAVVFEKLRMRIEIEEVTHPDGRVVIIDVPSRPTGQPLEYRGRYLMRSNDSVVPMSATQLQKIFAEASTDVSALLRDDARLADLDSAAVARFRASWARKAGNPHLETESERHLLEDAGLMRDGRLTNAALILLAGDRALARLLPAAEVVFEWRSGDRIEYEDRHEFRGGAFLFLDALWDRINLRNTRETFRERLFVRDIATFNEFAIREAILNAIAHRDYAANGSVFVRQYPKRIEIESPGGFPPGITPENILFKQYPRNRCLAEALQRTGLVERSGQGIDRMVETSLRDGKAPPDFSQTDDYQVTVILAGVIQDVAFLRFLEGITAESSYSFTPSDLFVLDRINRQLPVPMPFRNQLARLHEHGIVERMGRGRGTRYILSKRLYDFLGNPAGYTRRRGLDRSTNKELLATHLQTNARHGSSFAELCDVLPTLSRNQVKKLIQELKAEGRIRVRGATRGALWYPIGTNPAQSNESQ